MPITREDDPALVRARIAANRAAAQQQVAATQDPGATVENTVGSHVPTDVAVSLAQLGIDDPSLRRAARIAARFYDLTPQLLLGPKAKLSDLKSPITGGPMRLGEFRRLAS